VLLEPLNAGRLVAANKKVEEEPEKADGERNFRSSASTPANGASPFVNGQTKPLRRARPLRRVVIFRRHGEAFEKPFLDLGDDFFTRSGAPAQPQQFFGG
jgi:hypothetical protein